MRPRSVSCSAPTCWPGRAQRTVQGPRAPRRCEREDKGNCAACHPVARREDEHYDKFKLPTVRNFAISAQQMHKGCVTSLRAVVDFRITREVMTSSRS
jgi:cytochrome c peroxidase